LDGLGLTEVSTDKARSSVRGMKRPYAPSRPYRALGTKERYKRDALLGCHEDSDWASGSVPHKVSSSPSGLGSYLSIHTKILEMAD
jgi:hypothetical protein